MSKPKYSQSLDLNHGEICKFLRSHGVDVTDFAGAGVVPDTLLYHKGNVRWAEIKVPTRKASFKFKQLEYISQTKMDVAFVTSPEMALDYAINGTGRLNNRQKDAIAALLFKNKGKAAFTVKQIEDVLKCH